MSTAPRTPDTPPSVDRLPVTLPQIQERKELGQPIVMVTAYDFPSAQVAEAAGVDMVLVGDSAALQEAGCFSIVFEAIPAAVTELIMPRLEVPVIGIGAGPATDGQVLVFHDLLGIQDAVRIRFVKRYAEIKALMIEAVREYAEDVRARRFPGPEHTYSIDPDELAELRARMEG